MPTNELVSLPNVEHLSPTIIRILGQNPGAFTLQGTNTYLIGRGRERLLLDTGDGKPEYLALLDDVLEKEGASLSQVLITHHHPDHVGGLEGLLQKYPQLVVYSPVQDLAQMLKLDIPNQILLEHLQQVKVDSDITIRAYFTPGHSHDHYSFYYEEEEVLFTGDCVLGQGSTAVLHSLKEFLTSLEILQSVSATRLFPGHGPHIIGKEQVSNVLQGYIQHRLKREQQILTLIAQSPCTIHEIVSALYNKNISDSIRKGASYSVAHHLQKLYEDRSVDFLEASYDQIFPLSLEKFAFVAQVKWIHLEAK